MKEQTKLGNLLNTVIDQYIQKGDPVGSKFLHAMEGAEYAPSTLRKYLNLLEKSWLVYQPYNSSGRIPTVQGLSQYIDTIMSKTEFDDTMFDAEYSRNGLRYVVETLGSHVDGVVVWFLKNDEYYYLGINNLLNKTESEDLETTRQIVSFVESKKILKFLDTKMVKAWQVYYSFIDQEWDDERPIIMSCLYARVHINGYDGMICILWPLRVNYKKNLTFLQKLMKKFQ